MVQIVNLRKESYDVYIGRGSLLGNPFRIGIDGNRIQVIQKYQEYFYHTLLPIHKSYIHSLRGKTLGCYCKPQLCHGDIIKDYLDFGVDTKKIITE